MTEVAQWIAQVGAIGVFVLVFYSIQKGNLRTRQEFETFEKRIARAEAEADREGARSDAMLPAIQGLVNTVDRLTDQLGDLTAVVGGLAGKGEKA